jgi:hypothetical protein
VDFRSRPARIGKKDHQQSGPTDKEKSEKLVSCCSPVPQSGAVHIGVFGYACRQNCGADLADGVRSPTAKSVA